MAKREYKTYAQVKKIWASAKELDYDSAQLHRIVEYVTGKKSIARLTKKQAKEVIEELIELGASGGPAPENNEELEHIKRQSELPDNVIELPSLKQLELIETLKKQIGWGNSYFKGVLKRIIKKDKILTKTDARKMAQAMVKIEKNQRKEYNNDVV